MKEKNKKAAGEKKASKAAINQRRNSEISMAKIKESSVMRRGKENGIKRKHQSIKAAARKQQWHHNEENERRKKERKKRISIKARRSAMAKGISHQIAKYEKRKQLA